MRIAIITYHFPESTIPLAKHLVSDNCTVDYYYIFRYKSSKNIPGFDISNANLYFGLNKLSYEDAPETFKYIDKCRININVIYLPPKLNIFLIRKIFLSFIIFKINIKKYDLINIVGQEKLLIPFHEKLNCLKKIHTLHEVTDHFNNKNLDNPLIEYLLKNKIKIIVHSENSFKKICCYAKCNRSLIFIIPFGLFETYLKYEPVYLIPSSIKFILFFGYIHPYKGLDILSDAINLLQDNLTDIKFVIAGSGHIAELEYLKKNEKCIVINRHLTNNELVGLNKTAQFIVCPYKSASQSGIIMTTFLFGKPIIASNVGAFSEVITDGVNGMLVNPNSPVELAAAITKLITEKELVNGLQLGVHNFSKLQKYNWPDIAQKTKQVYFSDN